MASRVRTWFFLDEGSQTIDSKYRRLGADHKPSESTFQDLVDSVVFKQEEATDKATTTAGGIVRIATDAEAKARNNGTTASYSRVVQPSHLPSIAAATNQTISDFTGITVESVLDGTVTSRDEYQIKFSSAFITWLASKIGANHNQNTDTGTNSNVFSIGSLADEKVNLTRNGDNGILTILLPETSGTLALTSQLHTQNTDTGTTATTWVIRSGTNPVTLSPSSVTAPRTVNFPDKSGTFAYTNDSQYLPLQYEEVGDTAGTDVKKIMWPIAGTISVSQRTGFTSTNCGSYSTNTGSSYNSLITSTTFVVAAGDITWFRSTDASNVSVYSSAQQALLTLRFTPS